MNSDYVLKRRLESVKHDCLNAKRNREASNRRANQYFEDMSESRKREKRESARALQLEYERKRLQTELDNTKEKLDDLLHDDEYMDKFIEQARNQAVEVRVEFIISYRHDVLKSIVPL